MGSLTNINTRTNLVLLHQEFLINTFGGTIFGLNKFILEQKKKLQNTVAMLTDFINIST